MNAIIAEINRTVNLDECSKGVQLNGICELAVKSDQPHPVSIPEKKQVAPDDRYEAVVYHRLLNDVATDDLDNSFGSRVYKKHAQIVRTVVLAKMAKGKDWIDKFIDAMPEVIDGLTNYKLVNINTINKNTNQDEIFNTEFGEGNYEKHRLSYNIYALEYTVEYIYCG